MLAPSRVAAAMPTVGLVLKRGAPGAREVARRVIVRLAERGLRVVAESEEAAALGCDPVVDKAAMFEIASIIVVLGGERSYYVKKKWVVQKTKISYEGGQCIVYAWVPMRPKEAEKKVAGEPTRHPGYG